MNRNWHRINFVALFAALLGVVAHADVTLHRDAQHGQVIFATVSEPQPGSLAKAGAIAPVRPPPLAISDPEVLAGPGWSDTIAAAWVFLDEYAADFGEPDPRENLVVFRAERDRLGMSHVRFQQQVGGVPVMGGDLIVHLDARDDVRSAGGRFAPPTGLDTVPGLTEELAITLARLHWPQQLPVGKEPEVLRVELKVYCPGLTLNDGSADQFLVWDVWLGASCGPGCGNRWEEAFYMDAHTGELRGKMSLVAGLDRGIQNCSARLDDLCWSEYYDPDLDYTFGRREGTPERGPNPRYLPEISTDDDDAYELVGSIHDYLLSRFGRDGANGLGGTGNNSDAYHPYKRTMVNTYREHVSGTSMCPYGAMYWLESTNIEICKDMAIPDVLAHEYCHALDEHTAKLTYSGESGALSEANSYILAEAFSHYLRGTTDWRTKTESLPDAPYLSLRDPPSRMVVKTTLPCAGRFHSPNVTCNFPGPDLYVHAMICGKAAYLLSEGDYFNGCTIRAIGVERLEQVWYRALVHYFVSSETFNGAYAKLQQAAADLYPDDAHTRTQVRRAFQAVEMDQPGKCSGQPARVPQALDIQGW